ncbi:ML domain protein [Aspergillus transmontanensis]|uniref:Phosphatidylglycerol/phosphatidylinositol transfer protein n=1 Tax=Aspergillus transmontanensis TaxID=1034304 RepID=A0A5N6VR89_9EURO|nr:ML domain protein [Aspergillus transmontanensis]
MRVLSAAAALPVYLSFISVWVRAIALPSSSQDVWGLKVPGDNPLSYCESPSEDKLQIESLDISPQPLELGKAHTVKASLTLRETIEEGAYITLRLKAGAINLLDKTLDFCEEISKFDLECPLVKGSISLTKALDLPQLVPPGKFTVYADVYTRDDERITCLHGDFQVQQPSE